MMNHDLKYFWNDTVFVVYVSVLVQWDFNLYTFLSFYYRLVSLFVAFLLVICLVCSYFCKLLTSVIKITYL